jgi:hypothetical protein
MEEWMGRRGGWNGRREEMKEGEQGGKVEVDFISSLTMGKGSFVSDFVVRPFHFVLGTLAPPDLTKGTGYYIRGGEASRPRYGITDKPSLLIYSGYARIGPVLDYVTIPIPSPDLPMQTKQILFARASLAFDLMSA